MVTLLSAVVVLGILIFVHELGHFLVAKRAGVGVKTFSLGFGPRLFGFKKKETDYRLSLIPLGGYVRMVGEQPGEELAAEEQPCSFSGKSVWRRLAIVAAGPFSNIIFAYLVYYLVIVLAGVPSLTTRVGDLSPSLPAAIAGVQKDDMVLAINGQPVEHWGDMVAAIQASGGQPVDLVLERAGRQVNLTMQPAQVKVHDIFGEERVVYRVGIVAAGETITHRVGPFKALGVAGERTWGAGELIVMSVVKMFEGKVPLDTLGGPIQIGQVAGQAARHGFYEFVLLMALLSVNLAILNLLPIPALDGGHLAFFLFEAVTRRPVSINLRERAQMVGLALLIMLMSFTFYNDIYRLIAGNSQ